MGVSNSETLETKNPKIWGEKPPKNSPNSPKKMLIFNRKRNKFLGHKNFLGKIPKFSPKISPGFRGWRSQKGPGVDPEDSGEGKFQKKFGFFGFFSSKFGFFFPPNFGGFSPNFGVYLPQILGVFFPKFWEVFFPNFGGFFSQILGFFP